MKTATRKAYGECIKALHDLSVELASEDTELSSEVQAMAYRLIAIRHGFINRTNSFEHFMVCIDSTDDIVKLANIFSAFTTAFTNGKLSVSEYHTLTNHFQSKIK